MSTIDMCPICWAEKCWCPHWCKCTLEKVKEYGKKNPWFDMTRWLQRNWIVVQSYVDNIDTTIAWPIYWSMFHLLTYLNADKQIFLDLMKYYPCEECRIDWPQFIEWMYDETTRESKIDSMIAIHNEVNKKLWKPISNAWVSYWNQRLSIANKWQPVERVNLWEPATKLVWVNSELVRVPL